MRAAIGDAAFAAAWAAGRAATPRWWSPSALGDAAPPAASRGRPRADQSGGPADRREREVAALVARGLTNREIARELVITEGTVGVHVEHILAKLELRSRTQVAAWVIRREPGRRRRADLRPPGGYGLLQGSARPGALLMPGGAPPPRVDGAGRTGPHQSPQGGTQMTASQTRTAAQMVAEAKGRVENLTPVQVASELAAGRPLLVDLREPEERAQTRHHPRGGGRPAGDAGVLRRPGQPLPPGGIRSGPAHDPVLRQRRPLGAGRRRPSASWGTPASPIWTAASRPGAPTGATSSPSRASGEGRP